MRKQANTLTNGDVIVRGSHTFTVTGTSRAAASTADRIAVFCRTSAGSRMRGAFYFDLTEQVAIVPEDYNPERDDFTDATNTPDDYEEIDLAD